MQEMSLLRRRKSPNEMKTEWTNKWMRHYSEEEWVLKTQQAEATEMDETDDTGLKMQGDETEMLDDVTLTCSWCAVRQLKLANMCTATHCVGLLM